MIHFEYILVGDVRLHGNIMYYLKKIDLGLILCDSTAIATSVQ